MKFGRLPGHIPTGLRDLRYYAAGPLPVPPSSVPAWTNVQWGMLGNDQYGDCGAAGYDHGIMAAALAANQNEVFPDQDQVVSYYLTYTGGQDPGVVLADFLAYIKVNDFCGHTLSAYAPVAVNDVPALQFAVWAYGFAYTGISVTQQMMDDFNAGEPWTMNSLAGSVLGGHCIPIVGYDSSYLYTVTWGKVQPIAYSAWHHIAEESWAVLTGELDSGDGRGLNYAALQADIGRLAA